MMEKAECSFCGRPELEAALMLAKDNSAVCVRCVADMAIKISLADLLCPIAEREAGK